MSQEEVSQAPPPLPEAPATDLPLAARVVGSGPPPLNYFTPPLPLQIRYAGFWLRFCAAFIDWLITLIPTYAANLGIATVMGQSRAFLGGKGLRTPLAIFLSNLVNFTIELAYFAFQESGRHQATIGKRTVGIYVTAIDGQRLTWNNAVGRILGKYFTLPGLIAWQILIMSNPPIATYILLITFIVVAVQFGMAGLVDNKQAGHDVLAKTLVMRGSPQR